VNDSIARHTTPAAAIFLPLAFFFSVLSPTATEPNRMIYLACVGAVVLVHGLVILGVGLLRRPVGKSGNTGKALD
jgi:hypothetical protein